MSEVDKERERAAAKYILLRDLGEFLKRDRQTIKSTAVKLGIKVIRVRTSLGQYADAITADEARAVIAAIPPNVNIINPADL